MARIILGSYMVRYPLGGMMSWVLQYLAGFQQLGHDIYFVEKSGWSSACFDPVKDVMTDDCSYGIRIVDQLLARYGLDGRWCFVDAAGCYHGLSQNKIEQIFRSADLFIDMGTHGSWLSEAENTQLRVLIDGEPGFTQMKMESRLASGEELPEYDFYYSTGANIGTQKSTAPTAGKPWRHVFHPVAVDLFSGQEADLRSAFTTIMNWQSYEPFSHRGQIYGHKDVEFSKFVNLPQLTNAKLEIAVSGKQVPVDALRTAGWSTRSAHAVTISFDSFVKYIRASAGEFSVCKNGFVSTNSGWFSDRSAAYLASGRPVVMQDTGFSEHLPCGRGLFAVRTAEEAALAIEEICANVNQHSKWARAVAAEHLDSSKILDRFLHELRL